jgi:hypothetical protein
VVEQPDSRSSLAKGFGLASRLTTIGLEFALPAVGGYGLDAWLGTMPAATITGAVLGFLMGMLHAVRMAREFSGADRGPTGKPGPRGRPDQPT